MSRAATLRTKFNAALKKFGPMSRTVTKRTVTQTGGNALIGRPATVTTNDVLCDPQPLYKTVKTERVNDGAKQKLRATYEISFSADAITLDELQTPVLLVLIDVSGTEEPLEILDYTPGEVGGEYISFVVKARTM